MNFTTVNNVTSINGQNGAYDNKVKNTDVKYGRNAMSNYFEYLHELGFSKSDKVPGQVNADASQEPSLDFNLKYMPEEKVSLENLNKMALLGAAFVDLGNKLSVPLEAMTKKIQQAFGEKATAAAFDVNGDGQIDVAENAAAILIKDMADKHPSEEVAKTGALNLSGADIDGNITKVGENNFVTFLNLQKLNENKQLVTQIHQAFKLDEAKNIFAADAGNLVNP